MARLVDDEVLDTLTIVCAPQALAGESRPLRRAGRPHQRLVVAQGMVADVERESGRCDGPTCPR